AFGGPFSATNPLATLSPTFGIATITSAFSWQTNCDLIRAQPYQITIKAEDQQNPVKLVTFKSFNIKIVPPAIQNVTANPAGSNIIVNWQLSTCYGPNNPIIKYEIYRRDDCTPVTIQPCDVGAPAGFVLTGTVAPSVSTFTDTNNSLGLVVGQDYSYVVVALYSDGTRSFGSSVICTKLKRDVPILLNADVLSTASTGSVFVRWTHPLATLGNLDTNQLVGPYTFNLYHRLSGTQSYSQVYSVSKQNFYQLNTLADTTFIHFGINTETSKHEYKVEFVANITTVGSSQYASSIFLTTIGGERKVSLSWTEQTPWDNYSYMVFRKDPTQSTYTAIATTSLSNYTDSIGLANGSNYCYYIESEGKYSDPGITGPLFNKSQETCAIPVDITPPCSPTINIVSDCITGFVQINWTNVNTVCANDVIKYVLYKKETEDDEFFTVDTLYGSGSTTYQFDNLPDVAGCFAVSAIDSSGNISNKSEEICVDNCPVFDLPNIVTFNGDGINDFFKAIRVRHIKEIDLHVYDRWGTLVFRSDNPYFLWDGTSRVSNFKVSDGTFFYICDVYEKRVKGVKKRTLHGYLQVVN
ncbi:MAG: gliding motility-associated C-terminal domain-containing protein, partial [Bacteroidia bacterium]